MPSVSSKDSRKARISKTNFYDADSREFKYKLDIFFKRKSVLELWENTRKSLNYIQCY